MTRGRRQISDYPYKLRNSRHGTERCGIPITRYHVFVVSVKNETLTLHQKGERENLDGAYLYHSAAPASQDLKLYQS